LFKNFRFLFLLFCCAILIPSAFCIANVNNKITFYNIQDLNTPFPEEIDTNYISANQYKIDVLHYDINISLFPENKSIEAFATVTGVVTDKSLSQIDLNFYDNMTITDIKLNGIKTAYTNVGSVLTIPINKNITDTFKIDIAYKGRPKRMGLSSFVFGEINNNSLVYSLNEPNYASTWFPCNDMPSDKATLDIRITNDTPRVSVSNGILADVKEQGGKRTYHWQTKHPIATYLICLLSSNYTEFDDYYVNEKGDSLKLMYFAIPEHVKSAKTDFEDHPKYLKVFENLFGQYPFMDEKYGVAEFLWQMGAMENQTITTIGSNLVSGRKFFSDVYVHELAHHWWGDAVTPASWKDIWLNEGFATYSEALYFEAVSGPDALKSTMSSKYKRYFRERLYNTDGDLFSQTIYNKGAWVLHMLRKETGDSVFFSILRTYFETFKYKNASTEDFVALCGKMSGKDLTRFFKQWVYEGTGIIEASYSVNTVEVDGGYKVTVKIKQFQQEYPEFQFPLDIKFIFKGESNFTQRTVNVDSKEKTFEFVLKEKPVKILMDPDNWLLAYFTSGEDKN